MKLFRRASLGLASLLCLCGILLTASAQTPNQSVEERLSKIEAAATSAQTAGDNAWVLFSAALVLLMTGPGLALFYGGLVRKKNVVGTMMQSFILMALVTLLWALYGYSIAFAEGTSYFGGLSYAFLRGVGGAPNPDYAATIPQQTFMLFQLMFAIITPALISGAFAERVKFSAMLLFTTLWATIIYFPLAHMVWGKGGFLSATLGGRIPALDFAGGTVVHIASGFSALIFAIYVGKRIGYSRASVVPHNLIATIVGACLLWVGWFGFNAGSALAAGQLASSAFVATHFAAAAGTLGWVVAEWVRHNKPTALGAVSGAVCGLVAITPASGYVSPMSSLVIGFVAGLACFLMVTQVKKRLGYDDSLDVFGVHGTGGVIGAVLTGVFATRAINPVFRDVAGNSLPVGLVDGNGGQIINQLAAIGITVALAAVGTLAIVKFVDLILGVRVSQEDELQGLDLSQHGETAYGFDLDLLPIGSPKLEDPSPLSAQVLIEQQS